MNQDWNIKKKLFESEPSPDVQAHTHPQLLLRPNLGEVHLTMQRSPCRKQWHRHKSATQPTTCCSVKPSS